MHVYGYEFLAARQHPIYAPRQPGLDRRLDASRWKWLRAKGVAGDRGGLACVETWPRGVERPSDLTRAVPLARRALAAPEKDGFGQGNGYTHG
jgi:hypothetical protein